MIEVYHRNNPDFMTAGKYPTDYTRVASVDTGFLNDKRSLDIAYGLTQNVDKAWTKNGLAHPAKKKTEYRSTSVGDIIINDDGVIYVVKNIGFTEYK